MTMPPHQTQPPATALAAPPPQQTRAQQQADQSGEIRTLSIRHLKYCTDDDYLTAYFAHAGEVSSVKVLRNTRTGQVEGFGLTDFVTRTVAERVLQETYESTHLPMANTEHGFVGLIQTSFSAKVVIDKLTGRTKGYMLVRYGDESEQLRFNGVFCSTTPMRIELASNKKQYLKGCREALSSSWGLKLVSAEFIGKKIKNESECDNKTSDPTFVPHEIIFEILSRLPAKSLLRFKCVCKHWYHLIQDREFITQHWRRSTNVSDYSQREVAGLHVDGLTQETYTKLYNYGGLYVERGNVFRKYRVKNPTTRQVLYMPDPHQLTFGMFLTNYHTNGEFKLVSIYGNSKRPQGFEVFTIDRDDKWRPLKHFLIFEEGVKVQLVKTHNAIHLVSKTKDRSGFYIDVHSLDMGSEAFYSNTMPYLSSGILINWDGCFASVAIVEDKLKAIVLEDFKNHRWNEVIVPLTFLKENEDVNVKNLTPTGFVEGKLWLSTNDNKEVYVYDLHLRKFTDILPIQLGNTYLSRFRPSLRMHL